jgi:hypothetical protein
MFGSKTFLFSVAFCLITLQGVMSDPITSKEYKAMMKQASFTGDTTLAAFATKLANLKAALASYATSQGRSSSGSFTVKSGMPRQVKFYDTWYCEVYSSGYAFRMRRDSGNTDWEGTLKFRNAVKAVSDDRRTKMNQCATTDYGGKFEGDLSLGGSTVYAYSHDCKISNTKNINILDDVRDTWSEINQVWVAEFGWNLNTDIYLVNNMVITERVFSGFKVTFPGTVADFSVSLWYSSASSTTPLLAELSFTTDADADANVDSFWSGFGTATQLTPWLNTTGLFKTNWLYTQWGC